MTKQDWTETSAIVEQLWRCKLTEQESRSWYAILRRYDVAEVQAAIVALANTKIEYKLTISHITGQMKETRDKLTAERIRAERLAVPKRLRLDVPADKERGVRWLRGISWVLEAKDQEEAERRKKKVIEVLKQAA